MTQKLKQEQGIEKINWHVIWWLECPLHSWLTWLWFPLQFRPKDFKSWYSQLAHLMFNIKG